MGGLPPLCFVLYAHDRTQLMARGIIGTASTVFVPLASGRRSWFTVFLALSDVQQIKFKNAGRRPAVRKTAAAADIPCGVLSDLLFFLT
jgi:hypothetical protein